jgi:4-oxalocrotonate tautomerase
MGVYCNYQQKEVGIMPHINIKMYPGRDDATKKKAADAVAKALSESIGADMSVISVAIEDIPQSEWQEKVYDKELTDKNKNLFIKPGY